jgi:hypothetical protein
VHQAHLVGIIDRVGDVGHQSGGFLEGERPKLEQVPQRQAIDELGDDGRSSFQGGYVVDGDNAGMPELGG